MHRIIVGYLNFFLILFLKVGSYFFSTLMCPPLQGMNDSSIYIYIYIIDDKSFDLTCLLNGRKLHACDFLFFLNNAKSLQLQ